MTEHEWQAGEDPTPLLHHLAQRGNERKLRLFAAACCRRIRNLIPDPQGRDAILVVERFADGSATLGELSAACRAAWDCAGTHWSTRHTRHKALGDALRAVARAADPPSAENAAWACVNASWAAERANPGSRPEERKAQAALLRDLLGNPFRQAWADPAWLGWNAGAILKLARGIYDERLLPAGTFDPARLSVLADALEEAGCTDAAIVSHGRSPGPHVRGCWLVDLFHPHHR